MSDRVIEDSITINLNMYRSFKYLIVDIKQCQTK